MMKFLTDLISTIATHAMSLYNNINQSGIGQTYMGLKNTVRGFLGNLLNGLFGLFKKAPTAQQESAQQATRQEYFSPKPESISYHLNYLNAPSNSITYALNYFRQKEAEAKAEKGQEELRKTQTSSSKAKPD